MRLLHEKLQYFSRKHPKHYAIIQNESTLTYREVWRAVTSFSNWLFDNIERGSRIAVCLENTFPCVCSLYAIPAAGMIAVPVQPGMYEGNLSYILKDCNANVVVTSYKEFGKFVKLQKNPDLNLRTIILCDTEERVPQDAASILSLNRLIKSSKKAAELKSNNLSENDTAVILYTTGTTGPRKGVKLSHFNLLSATRNINQFMQFSDGVVESLPMPLSHSFGFARLRSVFDVGGTVVLENGLIRPEWVLHNIERYNANSFSSVPAGFEILLNNFYKERFKKIGGRLKFIEIGSASMCLEHKKLLIEYCPSSLICMHFGLTEASRSTFIEFHSEKWYLNTAGKASPNVSVKICGEDGKFLAKNAVGEILIKGDMVMQGYWNKDELTKKTLRDGWLHTADIGFTDENGYLHLLGRKEDIINIGGWKVGPIEVEGVLLKFQGISKAAVVAIPSSDGRNNQTIRAYLVVAGDRGKFINPKELKKFCLAHMEPYKVPQEFVILNSLPTASSGKILKNILRDEMEGAVEIRYL